MLTITRVETSWQRASTLTPPAHPASRSARWTMPTAIPTGKTTHNTAHKRGQKHCPRFLLTAFFVKTILKSRIWSNVNILWTTFFGLFSSRFGLIGGLRLIFAYWQAAETISGMYHAGLFIRFWIFIRASVERRRAVSTNFRLNFCAMRLSGFW